MRIVFAAGAVASCGQRGVRCAAVATKRGDVLLLAEGISKSHDGEKQLFAELTVSVVRCVRVQLA